jgi:hypothetical protein
VLKSVPPAYWSVIRLQPVVSPSAGRMSAVPGYLSVLPVSPSAGRLVLLLVAGVWQLAVGVSVSEDVVWGSG